MCRPLPPLIMLRHGGVCRSLHPHRDRKESHTNKSRLVLLFRGVQIGYRLAHKDTKPRRKPWPPDNNPLCLRLFV